GVIPQFLVIEGGGQRYYDQQAIEWILLAFRIKRVGGDATYEKIGKIFEKAIERWGADRETLLTLHRLLQKMKNYPRFVDELSNKSKLDLPEYIKADSWIDDWDETNSSKAEEWKE